MRFLYVLAIFIFCKPSIGADPKGYIALIYHPDKNVDSIRIPIYSNINEKVIGYCRINPANGEDGAGLVINTLFDKEFPVFKFPLEPLQSSIYYAKKYNESNSPDSCEYYCNGYQLNTYHLTYYEVKAGYIKILANTIENGAWIKLNDSLFKPIDWVDEIISNWYGPYIYGYDNYRLRKNPSLESEIVIKLKYPQYTILEYTQRKGNWIEIIVCKLKPEVDIVCEEAKSEEDCIKVYKGWIRIVDESGMPEDIWFSTDC